MYTWFFRVTVLDILRSQRASQGSRKGTLEKGHELKKLVLYIETLYIGYFEWYFDIL